MSENIGRIICVCTHKKRNKENRTEEIRTDISRFTILLLQHYTLLEHCFNFQEAEIVFLWDLQHYIGRQSKLCLLLLLVTLFLSTIVVLELCVLSKRETYIHMRT